MASRNVTSKSQLKNVRIPHDVLDGMESVKLTGESTTSFIITAMEAEITRRQLRENGEEKILSRLNGALSALEQIEKVGANASDNIRELISVAQSEIRDIKGCATPARTKD